MVLLASLYDRIKGFKMSGEDINQGAFYKVKKVMRYIRLYGFLRTFVKVKGQYHMKSIEGFTENIWINKACKSADNVNRCVAIIGCGYYPYSVIAFYMKSINKDFLRCTLDIDRPRARSLCFDYGGVYATDDLDAILSDKQVKLVFIASNHSSHAEYAERCIKAGKHVHIEKPHVVSYDQLEELTIAQKCSPDVKVFLGFNRPRSYLFSCLMEALKLQSGPSMINWFIVGHHLEDNHWYYDAKEGGRILGNLSHWSDLTLHLVGIENAFPCEIIPATLPGSKSDYIVAINFADGSAAVISFSAKGQTATGVRELLNLQKQDCLASLSNFEALTIDVGDFKKTYKPFYRDHGHRNNILNSYSSALSSASTGESLEYIRSTARFFLAIRDAMAMGEKIVITSE